MKEEIKYFVAPSGEEPFTIEMSGISYCDGSYLIDRPNSGILVMEYVEKGTGTVQLGKHTRFSASAGDVYFLPAGEDHYYYSDAKDPWTKYFFNLKGELPETLLYAYQIYGTYRVHCPQAKPLFEKFIRTVFTDQSREEIFSACALLFHEILIELRAVCKSSENIPQDALILKSYLDQNLSRQVSIQELSSQINRSADYTIKLFKKYYHQTPYAYFLHQKMEAAKNLLSNTSFSIQEIANGLGYDDQHYFSNLFKQFCGCAPKFYKNKVKE